MTELSPVTEEVLTAVTLKRYDVPPEGLPAFAEEMAPLIAAALRALNKFVHMDQPLGDSDADAGVFVAHQAIHGYIECIATELESLPD
jgi:hypothetical protein